MLTMFRHARAFAAVLAGGLILIGCAGNGDSRQTGTDDPRILGDWIAKELHFGSTVVPCPGQIESNSQTASCTADTTTFDSAGHYTVGAKTDDFLLNQGNMVLYNRAGNATNYSVVFDSTGNEMTWTFTLDGQNAQLIVDRSP
jgi:hypothetical protein